MAGGQSRRMGRDKRLLEVKGKPFLDHVCTVLNEVFNEVIVVGSQYDYDCAHLRVRYVTDAIPEKGSIGGLYTGLLESTTPYCFVVGCDMPFLNKDVIQRLCSQPERDVTLVRLATGLQTLHARYSQQCLFVVQEMIAKKELRIQALVDDARLAVQLMPESLFDDLDPHRHSFLNMNTPADLEYGRKLGLGVS